MAFTFNPDLSTPRDQVRQRIGDTDSTDVELQDATIDAYLTMMANSVLNVAYRCATDLMAKYARQVEVTVDHQTTRANQAFEAYKTLADAILLDIRQAAAGATETYPGIWMTGSGDHSAPYDKVPTLPWCD